MFRMTKLVAAVAVLFLAAPFSHAGGSSDKNGGLSLYDAIEQTGEKIAGELPQGSRVAIVAFESGNDNLSDYIMEELTGALFDRKIEVADRQNLEYVYKELRLQMSGDVSDESALSIGKFLGADMVITGQLLDLDGAYRYRTSAINVETAVRASVTRLDVRSDKATRRMMTALANQQTSVKAAKYGVSADVTPQTAGTFFDRALLFASRNDHDMAIADFTEAIRLDPNMVAAYIRRGVAYMLKGDRDMAMADLDRAIQVEPNSADAYDIRAGFHILMRNIDQGIADYTQAIRFDPNQQTSYYFLSRVYEEFGLLDRGIADFSQFIKTSPNNAYAYHYRGVLYMKKGDHDRAIADFTQAIRLNPNNADAYIERGLSYMAKFDLDRTIADFEAALRINPNDSQLREFLEETRQMRNRR